MKFVLQHTLLNSAKLEELFDAVKAAELPYVPVGVIPFSGEIISDDPLDGIDWIPYGSCSLVKTAYERGWKGCFFDPEIFRTSVYRHKRDDMLNHDEQMFTASEILGSWIPTLGDKWFVRPINDLKLFAGSVMTTNELLKWVEGYIKVDESFAEVEIGLSQPKEILAEWRYFIIEGKIVTGSQYRNDNTLYVKRAPSYILDEAQEFADKWLPHKNCVMDLALDGNKELKVIEFNGINASGFYDCNIKKIVQGLYQEALKL